MNAIGRGCAVLALVAASASCAQDSVPEPDGVGPDSNAHVATPAARSSVELTQPNESAAAVALPVAERATTAGTVVIGPDIADLGPFDVLTWDAAVAQAAQRIQPDEADAELARLRTEIEGRP